MSSRRTPGRAGIVTSVDVARAAGVSQSVVSRAFSFDASVAQATRDRIFTVAGELGYRPNLLARSLITKQSNLFALVTGALTNPLHLSVIEAFTRMAQERGYRVLLFTTPPGKPLDAALESVLQYRPDGVFAMAGTPSERMVEECRRSAVPVVLFGREDERGVTSSVSCDNVAEARRVARLLVDGGHRRFAFVASRDPALSFSLGRERGFSEAICARTGEAPVVENGGSSYEGGYAAARRLLGGSHRPDAIFCASDAMALGVLDAARREFALGVPTDLSVVGFDDVPMAAWASYELTTVRQRVDEMVEAATELLLAPSEIARCRLVPGDLVLRKSARLAPNEL